MPKILMVDDQINAVRVMTLLLGKANFQVVGCTDGEEALRVIASDPAIDLMIIDMKMPGMSGMDIAKKAREAGKTFPILFQTGDLDIVERESEKLKSVGVPPENILCKPVEFSEVLARIHAALHMNGGK